MACSTTALISDAVAIAEGADLVILAIGLDGTVEGEKLECRSSFLINYTTLIGEMHDRVPLPCNGVNANEFELPGCQYQLVEAINGTSAKSA